MSIKQKLLKKEDLEKFDTFIQDTLDRYIDVKVWDELIQTTGEDSNYIISNKSTIPDLVIYNKGFNKRNCFYYSNRNKGSIHFPRKLFILRPKKIKEYNSSSPYIMLDSNKNEKNKENEEPFEFKKIPEDIEKKYMMKKEEEKNDIIDELIDFLKCDSNNVPKTKLNKEEIKENDDKKLSENDNAFRKNSYKENVMNVNNKFSGVNSISAIDFRNKMIQNMKFNELLYKNMFKLKPNNKFNTGNFAQNLIFSPENSKNNLRTINFPSYYYSPLNYYGNQRPIKGGINYLAQLDSIMKNNITERIWLVVHEKNTFVHSYNNEEIYYYLNDLIKRGELQDLSINCTIYPDIFVAPIELYNNLKLMYEKK